MGLKFKPGGINQSFDETGRLTEVYSSTCSHCQRITDFPSMREMHNHVDICRSCMKLVCVDQFDTNGVLVHRGCAGRPCVTWLKQCEIEEAIHARNLLAGA
jgi:hypothetical protein